MLLVVAATERELGAVEGADTLVCGVGPVEAAAATARALAERRPRAVLHVGLAGGRGLEPCTAVLGTESLYEDLEAAIPVIDRAEPATALVDALAAAVPELRRLPIATSARVGAAAGAAVEAMEGFGVLRAAALAGIPAVEVRVVSNEIGERDRTRWRFDDALETLEALLPRLLAAVRP
ncbi:MAG TPA: hypothetical protein VM204_08170 [Gaiellaceae bacterium]|nr:hypothetical protein [Gaiellaceae bacterium]